jgi:hypothetical protein
MARKTSKPNIKPKSKRPLLKSRETTEATVDEFEREDMGIASKE